MVGCPAREPGSLEAHRTRLVLEPVVGLADAGGRERIRGRDVGAGREVVVVDRCHEGGLRQVEEIRVALNVVRVVTKLLASVLLLRQAATVDEHAPGSVEDEDPRGEELA